MDNNNHINPELMEEIQRVAGIVKTRNSEVNTNLPNELVSEDQAEEYLHFLHRELRMHSRMQISS